MKTTLTHLAVFGVLIAPTLAPNSAFAKAQAHAQAHTQTQTQNQVQSQAHVRGNPPVDFDLRHKQCLEAIAKDADLAYENALVWMSEGGGRRAIHCSAMALFALGQEDEAAFRIQNMALDKDHIALKIRKTYFAEAADLWLQAGVPHKAYDIATKGLVEASGDVPLHIVRARAYAALGHWDYAQTDLNSALAFEPNNTEALRYRADTRRRLGELDLAKADIEKAVRLDFQNVDTLVVRGQINEAIRLKVSAAKTPKSITGALKVGQ